jgi:hypothetical protein
LLVKSQVVASIIPFMSHWLSKHGTDYMYCQRLGFPIYHWVSPWYDTPGTFWAQLCGMGHGTRHRVEVFSVNVLVPSMGVFVYYSRTGKLYEYLFLICLNKNNAMKLHTYHLIFANSDSITKIAYNWQLNFIIVRYSWQMTFICYSVENGHQQSPPIYSFKQNISVYLTMIKFNCQL